MPNPFADEATYRKMVEHLRKSPAPKVPPQLSAEEDIANTIADIRKGRVTNMLDDPDLFAFMLENAAGSTNEVVDATPLYLANADKDEEVSLYDVPNVAPPWPDSLICYQNHHGNVLVMHTRAMETPGHMLWKREVPPDNAGKSVLPDYSDYKRNPTEDDVDETRVRWSIESTIWLGGQGGDGRRVGTRGPLHVWRMAVYSDGTPADIGWCLLQPDYPMEYWDTALLVFLNTLNFMNCKNIELVEPTRQRPERRRLERQEVIVKTLSVFNVSRRTLLSGGKGAPSAGGTPLTSVRGHFSTYGPEYGKGKLFGKLEGRFWIPQHARGDAANGQNINVYKPRP